MSKPKIITQKVSTKYVVSSGDNKHKINVEVSGGQVTFTTYNGKREFVFQNSNKERVVAIAKLMIKATELE